MLHAWSICFAGVRTNVCDDAHRQPPRRDRNCHKQQLHNYVIASTTMILSEL
jgi:hypothetical protein